MHSFIHNCKKCLLLFQLNYGLGFFKQLNDQANFKWMNQQRNWFKLNPTFQSTYEKLLYQYVLNVDKW